MKRILLSFVIILVLTIFLNGSPGDESLKVSPGGTLFIDVVSPNITINVWNKNEVLINTTQNKHFKVLTNNNRVRIEQSGTGSPKLLTINIPSVFNLNIKLTAGDVKINGDIRGTIEIYNSGGDIDFRNISGKTAISTGGGDIRGFNISGNATLKTSGGDISAGSIKGITSVISGGGDIKLDGAATVELIQTSGGNIFIKSASGNGNISTGGGNISIGKAGGKLAIMSVGGDIRINKSEGRIAVKTGAGTIRMKDISGSINVRTESGDIITDFKKAVYESRILTGNGSVRIGAAENLRAKIAARASDTEWWNDESSSLKNIKSDFKLIALKRNKSTHQVEAVYELNGGGPVIQVRTDHGEIIIKKN